MPKKDQNRERSKNIYDERKYKDSWLQDEIDENGNKKENESDIIPGIYSQIRQMRIKMGSEFKQNQANKTIKNTKTNYPVNYPATRDNNESDQNSNVDDCLFEAEGFRLRLKVPKTVYNPCDDSMLLAKNAIDRCRGEVLEIGCGSGAVSLLLAKAGRCKNIQACDINQDAVDASIENARQNKLEGKIRFFVSDLFSSVERGKKFDFIIFNPPYLPTEQQDKVGGRLNLALDGGKTGLETVNRFIDSAKNFLKPGAEILLVGSSLWDTKRFEVMLEMNGLRAEKIDQQDFFFEKIILYCIKRAEDITTNRRTGNRIFDF